MFIFLDRVLKTPGKFSEIRNSMLVKEGHLPTDNQVDIPVRKILHIDMDAFFASVEQRDFPGLRGRPVVVGGDPGGRGVVAAASYEARRYGIHSAMPSAHAVRRCPQAIFRKPRFEVYKSVSADIRDIFARYTDLVEPLSLDEAYLDVTHNKVNCPSATYLAQEIRRAIKSETGLTASAGVAGNKFLAKMASGQNKPDGLYVITPEASEQFLEQLPIGKFHGVGRATCRKMESLGIYTGHDLKQWHEADLVRHFGKSGHRYYQIVRGRDDREVKPNRIRKSVGKERTFTEDLSDMNQLQEILKELAGRVAGSLDRHGASGKTVTLKVRYRNFETVTRSTTLQHHVKDEATLARIAIDLLDETEAGLRRVRLLGITVSSLDTHVRQFGEQLEINFHHHTQRSARLTDRE